MARYQATQCKASNCFGQNTCELVAEVFIIALKDPFCTEDIEKLLSQQKSHLVNGSSRRRIGLTRLYNSGSSENLVCGFGLRQLAK